MVLHTPQGFALSGKRRTKREWEGWGDERERAFFLKKKKCTWAPGQGESLQTNFRLIDASVSRNSGCLTHVAVA